MKIRILTCAIGKLTVCQYLGKFTYFFSIVQEENLFPKVICVDSLKKKKLYEKISESF